MNEEMKEQLDRIEATVNDLRTVVMTLLSGIGQAQSSGGMAGMMARQFPDMTGIMSQMTNQG